MSHDISGREIYAKDVANTQPHSAEYVVPDGFNTKYFIVRFLQSLAQLFLVSMPRMKINSGCCHLDHKLDNIAFVRLDQPAAEKYFKVKIKISEQNFERTVLIPLNGKRIVPFDWGFAFLLDSIGQGWISQASYHQVFNPPLQYNNTSTDIVQTCLSCLQTLVRRWPTAMQILIAECLHLPRHKFTGPGQIDPRIVSSSTHYYRKKEEYKDYANLADLPPLKETDKMYESAITGNFAYKSWVVLINFLVQTVRFNFDKNPTMSSPTSIVTFDPYLWEVNMYTEASQLFSPHHQWIHLILQLLQLQILRDSAGNEEANDLLLEHSPIVQPSELANGSSQFN